MTSKRKDTKKSRTVKNISVKNFIDYYAYRIDLDADYQREVIWSRKQQLELLDSILKDIDIPKLYLVKVDDGEQFEFECIDGKQRMTAILNFFSPDDDQSPLTVEVTGKNYSYPQLKKTHPTIASEIEDYELTFVIYKPFNDEGEFVRQIFRRLQLGVRLNTGELLKTQTGTIRDFIYKDIGENGPFLRITNLSLKRYSRPFTLAQICINSFSKASTGNFVRARYDDLKDFFEEYHSLNKNDSNLVRIKTVLKAMDTAFNSGADIISSRAVAVSGYLFAEELIENNQEDLMPDFASFYSKLLSEIQDNMELLSALDKPNNKYIMEEFQKYILQGSVEGYSIERRHKFLGKAFSHFISRKSKGEILDGE